ncbi:hypothetical protein J6590_084258 [Homalodisca vitripennis]|nr:hypothetical protein J6590_084258 [Homalodisca vitripennis]
MTKPLELESRSVTPTLRRMSKFSVRRYAINKQQELATRTSSSSSDALKTNSLIRGQKNIQNEIRRARRYKFYPL